MRRRYIFKRWNNSDDTTLCNVCHKNQTLFFILDRKNGEEWWCCPECALKYYKIKRLVNLLKKYPVHIKKAISDKKSLIKKSENELKKQVSGAKNEIN